jgi:porin
MLWAQSDNPTRSVSAFGRAMWTPQGDRNLIDFSLNLGIVYHYPLANRPDDVLGLAMGYAHVSPSAAGLDADTAFFSQAAGNWAFTPVRSSETYMELTYLAQVRPWWQIQLDFQYVFSPGGGIVNPNNASQLIWDEFVVGMRTNILF